MLKALLLDIGGVIHSNDGVNPLYAIAADLGVDPEVIKEHYEQLMSKYFKGEITLEQLLTEIAAGVGKQPPADAGEVVARGLSASKLYPNVVAYVRGLKGRGYSIYALSNTIDPHAAAQHKRGVYILFDALFLSNETGLRKPDRAAFEHVLTEVGLAAGEMLFVDDDPVNVAAAASLGFQTILAVDEQQIISAIGQVLDNQSIGASVW